MRLHNLKKFIIVMGTATALGMFGITAIQAQGGTGGTGGIPAGGTPAGGTPAGGAAAGGAGGTSDQNLQIIANNTTTMVTDFNNLPTYLQSIGQFILAWMNPDTSPPTVAMAGNLSQLGTMINQNQTDLLAMQAKLNNDHFSNDGNNAFNANNGKALSGSFDKTKIWYANDLTYSSVLGQPYLAKDGRPSVDPIYNYVKNASGLNLYHKVPDPSWKAGDANTRYQDYYNTVMAAESFNAYALSTGAVEAKNSLSTLQTTLITQASDPKTWSTQVASESIGFVLRQILLYESQNFVIMTQMWQTQKQMLAAQAVTNAVIIASNAMNENILASNAAGTQASLK